MPTRRVVPISWLVFAIASHAAAQSTPTQQTQTQTGAATQQPAAQSTPPGGESNAPPVPTTAEEMIAQGETIVQRGTTLAQTVRGMLEDARKQADIIKINCLDSKLTQIDANLRTGESRLDALKKAVSPDLRLHEYTVLTVIAQKLQVLDQEAHQCVGQGMYETGATKVTTEIDTNMLPFETNPSVPPVILPPSLPTIPPPSSGTQ